MDSGWLGILKASAWQLLGLSAALLVFRLLFEFGILPESDSNLIIYGLPFAILVSGFLGLASLLEEIVDKTRVFLQNRWEKRQDAKRIVEHTKKFLNYIPTMNDHERRIYGWLLKNNQKSFSAEMDCGHGSSLYKRGFIKSDVIGGLAYVHDEFPFSIPDHIWEALLQNSDQFPQEFDGQGLPWFRARY